ncbi:FeoA family protein [Syntrophobotulus glycolicus DSM 8271]|uniref:FeoA family protein n=1 Tax=Syntrophobotulus glycolicus (strain DSM 8271 / FlGlyR) TaxID=645991 RepID=F0SV78_SYNGF|nr:FeoA family protein [Syntrophobotulus glycolicus]ADY55578.1 FeoA family protein [Syntrophobotulus glycolicus DSM 8271]
MQPLHTIEEGASCQVQRIDGDTRFISRITSVGITPGCTIKVLRNKPFAPILVYSRDTVLAINKNEANRLLVKGDG